MMGDTYVLSKYISPLLPARIRFWIKQISFIKASYKRNLNRELNLIRPTLYSEKIQWRKLFEASSKYTQLSDKIAVCNHISDKGYSSLLIPKFWIGSDPALIPFDAIPRPFVLKGTHAAGQTIIISEDQPIDRDSVIAQARQWLTYCHGTALIEPGYLNVPRGLVIEPLLICEDGKPPAEVKVFVFDGVARFAQYIEISKDRDQRFVFVDREWNPYPWHGSRPPLTLPTKPTLFDFSINVAERLCEDMNHCRVDFYLIDNEIFVGEMTLYSFSGEITLRPQDADLMMGSFWILRWPKTRAAYRIMLKKWGYDD